MHAPHEISANIQQHVTKSIIINLFYYQCQYSLHTFSLGNLSFPYQTNLNILLSQQIVAQLKTLYFSDYKSFCPYDSIMLEVHREPGVLCSNFGWFCFLQNAQENIINPFSSGFGLNTRAEWAILFWGGNQPKRRKTFNSRPAWRETDSVRLACLSDTTAAIAEVCCSSDPQGLQGLSYDLI